MQLTVNGKHMTMNGLKELIVQGESKADRVSILIQRNYDGLDLGELHFVMMGLIGGYKLEQPLDKVTTQQTVELNWLVTEQWTRLSGAMLLEVVGTDLNGDTVWKLTGDPIIVRRSIASSGAPPEDIAEQYLKTFRALEARTQINADEASAQASNAKQSAYQSSESAMKSSISQSVVEVLEAGTRNAASDAQSYKISAYDSAISSEKSAERAETAAKQAEQIAGGEYATESYVDSVKSTLTRISSLTGPLIMRDWPSGDRRWFESDTGALSIADTASDTLRVEVLGVGSQVHRDAGKNLLNPALIARGTLDANTGAEVNSDDYTRKRARTDFMPAYQGGIGAISGIPDGMKLAGRWCYDADLAFLGISDPTPDGTVWVRIAFSNMDDTTEITDEDISNLKSSAQYELAGSSTSYEPYTPAQPSPDAPAPMRCTTGTLRVTGKNCCINRRRAGESETVNGVTATSNADGTVTVHGTRTGNGVYPLCQSDDQTPVDTMRAGTTYTLHQVQVWYRTDGVNDRYLNASYQDLTVTPEVDYSVYGYRILLNANTPYDNQIFSPQIEVGSSFTGYAPYQEQSLNLPAVRGIPQYGDAGALTGWTLRDEVIWDGHGARLVRRIGEVELDGTESGWIKDPAAGSAPAYFSLIKSNLWFVGMPSSQVLCSHFKAASAGGAGKFRPFAGYAGFGFYPLQQGLTVEDWKEWLAAQKAEGTPVTVWYPLSEPVSEPLSEAPLCALDGATRLSVDGLPPGIRALAYLASDGQTQTLTNIVHMSDEAYETAEIEAGTQVWTPLPACATEDALLEQASYLLKLDARLCALELTGGKADEESDL